VSLFFQLFTLAVTKTSCGSDSQCTLIWMCLERCSPFNLNQQLAMLRENSNYLMVVSPENWQVSSQGTFQWATHNGKPVSNVTDAISKIGIPYFPMLTSGEITSLRKLWKNPIPFVREAIHIAKQFSYLGYHIDFEPESGVVVGDASLYCKFLDYFSHELHLHGLILSADVARWSVLWDFDLLAKTGVDRICTMQTYTSHIDRFEREVNYTMTKLGKKAVIGIDTDISGITVPIMNQMLVILKKFQVNEINFWTDNVVLSSDWISFIRAFQNNKAISYSID